MEEVRDLLLEQSSGQCEMRPLFREPGLERDEGLMTTIPAHQSFPCRAGEGRQSCLETTLSSSTALLSQDDRLKAQPQLLLVCHEARLCTQNPSSFSRSHRHLLPPIPGVVFGPLGTYLGMREAGAPLAISGSNADCPLPLLSWRLWEESVKVYDCGSLFQPGERQAEHPETDQTLLFSWHPIPRTELYPSTSCC